MRQTWAALALAAVTAGTAAAGGAPDDPAPEAPVLVIPDQAGRPHWMGPARGDVVVLVYGDRPTEAANVRLGRELHSHFHPGGPARTPAGELPAVRPIDGWPEGRRAPDVHVVAITCAGKVPGPLAPVVRAYSRLRAPGAPVLLDCEDKMKEYYGLAAGVTNIVVLDTGGKVRYRAHGTLTPAAFKQLAGFIEQLRVEAKGVTPDKKEPTAARR
jgi:hypothetical protein